jgi:hypothetical protein
MHFRTGSPENDAGLPVLQNMSNKFNSTNLIHIVQKKGENNEHNQQDYRKASCNETRLNRQ